MSLLGEDFKKATTRWLYPRDQQMNFWRGLGLALGVFAVYNVLQYIIVVIVLRGDLSALVGPMPPGSTDASAMLQTALLKAGVISLFPCGILTAALSIYVAPFGLPKRLGKLPLHWPNLSVLGWSLVLFAFFVVTVVIAVVVVAVSGVDPSNAPGAVEKTLTELSKDPVLSVLGALSSILGAPLAEEFIFRGLLFAAMARTVIGWPGTVIVTSALWALLHISTAPIYGVVVIFGMGLVLGVLLLRFGSLWVTIACHTLWNVIVTLNLFTLGQQS